MSLLPVSNWKTPTLLGDRGASHRIVVTLKNGDVLGGVLYVAQTDSLQMHSGSAIWTLFASEWESVSISPLPYDTIGASMARGDFLSNDAVAR